MNDDKKWFNYDKEIFLDDMWEHHEAHINASMDMDDALRRFEERMNKVHREKDKEVECDCGSHKVYGTNCDMKLHSHWCSLRKEIEC